MNMHDEPRTPNHARRTANDEPRTRTTHVEPRTPNGGWPIVIRQWCCPLGSDDGIVLHAFVPSARWAGRRSHADPRDAREKLERIVDDVQKEPARINALEIKVEALDGQFVQLRGEMRAEFSATRDEISAGFV